MKTTVGDLIKRLEFLDKKYNIAKSPVKLNIGEQVADLVNVNLTPIGESIEDGIHIVFCDGKYLSRLSK